MKPESDTHADAEFREQEHPRDQKGKFKKGPGAPDAPGDVDHASIDADMSMVEYEHARMGDRMELYGAAETPEDRVEEANELKVSADDIAARMKRVLGEYDVSSPGEPGAGSGDDFADLELAHEQMRVSLQDHGASENDHDASEHARDITYQARQMQKSADALWKQAADEIEAAREAPKSENREERNAMPESDEIELETSQAVHVGGYFGGMTVVLAGRSWALRTEAMEALAAAMNDGVFVSADFDEFRAEGEVKLGTPQIAVIPLGGLITPGGDGGMFSFMFGGSGGLDTFRKRLADAANDPDVKHIVLDIDSPGGLVDQVPETAAMIRQVRDVKPITAVANTQMASAAYWLGSQADELVVTPSGDVGSIGVYMMHTDVSKAAKQAGVKVTLTSAGRYKTEGNQFEPLSASAKKASQEKVDTIYEMFVADVAAGRGVTPSAVRMGYGEGRTELSAHAVDEGLADRVGTFDEALGDVAGGIDATHRDRVAATVAKRRRDFELL